jgi:uncharacterized protein YbjT (DUF2867 family)
MNASEILVTGGTGSLGRLVVARLRDGGRDVRVLSRRGHPGTIPGDLLTGEGLEEAVEGARTIVHCASSPTKTRRVDVEGTQRLLRAASLAGVQHVVFISIVGIDRNPYFPYYRSKFEVERIVKRSSVPWTILRATQLHEFVLRLIRFLDRLPVMPVPKGPLLQPIDAREVANRLVELALSSPAGRVPDIAGPEIGTFADFARAYFEACGRGQGILEVPVPGKMEEAFRQGAHLAPEGKYGRTTWEEFLDTTFRPRFHDAREEKLA